MLKTENVVGIIPARGGSKGLPGKNVRSLNGKPLIAYTIETSLKCPHLDRVIVSTDSVEIAQIARKCGAEVPFMRPAELATDTSHTPDTLIHAVQALEAEGWPVGSVVTLQPTSPLRRTDDITRSVELLYDGGFDSVATVRENDFPPYWTLRVESGKLVPLFDDGVRRYFNLERQELPATYRCNGAVFVTRKPFIMNEKTVVTAENCGVIVMPARESMDIDTLEDFERIEKALNASGAP